MNDVIKSELTWWNENIMDSKRFIKNPEPDLVLYSDACTKGWGGHIKDGTSTGGDWSAEEMKLHINILELKAAFLTLQTFCRFKQNIHVKLMIDNTTAIACVNKFGSVKPLLMAQTVELYNWAIQKNLILSAAHVPGKQNVVADRESRTRNLDIEWRLKDKWFKYITEQLGTPEIDLFASRINKQLPKYVSWKPDPFAIAIDAFSMSWSNAYLYIFPPFSLMTRVLGKIVADKADVLLVFPDWQTQPWWARLRKLLVGTPIDLPWSCLELPQVPGQGHALKGRLHLKACRVLGTRI